VTQSQFIGAVGMTGWSTGPHLHFEYRVNGDYADPSTIADQGGGTPIAASSRQAFERIAKANRTELAAAFSVVQASAD
jgi:murein DD-endopeptidase MepM/ murein hydrolase activator NlpD